MKIVARRESLRLGQSRYFTGNPCKHGHIAERVVANGVCVTCHLGRMSARNKTYDRAAPKSRATTRGKTGRTSLTIDQVKERADNYVRENHDAVLARGQKYYSDNRQSCYRRTSHNRWVKNLGVTADEYDLIMSDHKGRCDLCGTDEPRGPHGRFALDHCHRTGLLRGVLCTRCNTVLGHCEDDPDLLRNAISYLKRPPRTQRISDLLGRVPQGRIRVIQ